MERFDSANGARARTHHHRLRRRTEVMEPDAAQKVTVGYRRGGEEAVVTRDKIVGRQDACEVVAQSFGHASLLLVARDQHALDLTPETFRARPCYDPPRGAADAQENVGAGVRPTGRDGTRDVAVGDGKYASTGLANFGEQVIVAWSIEDDDAEFGYWFLQTFGKLREIVGRTRIDVDRATGSRSHGDLVHVDARAGVEHRASLRKCDDRQCPVAAHRSERRSVDGVDRDVHEWWATVTDLLAVVEHRRVVLFAFTDHHNTVHGNAAEDEAHRIDRRTVGRVLVAATGPACRGDGRCFSHTNQFERDIAVRLVRLQHKDSVTCAEVFDLVPSHFALPAILVGGQRSSSSPPVHSRATFRPLAPKTRC